jgi:hypothetical protein
MRETSMSKYIVSKQLSYPDGEYYVEIETGGPDMSSPDMIEMIGEYDCPREAANAAIDALRDWRDAEPDLDIGVSIGSTMGGLASHYSEDLDYADILLWGDITYEATPKCDRCGKMIPVSILGWEERIDSWISNEHGEDSGKFCSEYCCGEAVRQFDRENEEVVIKSKSEWLWWNGKRNDWVEELAQATIYTRLDVEENLHDDGMVVGLQEALEDFERKCPIEVVVGLSYRIHYRCDTLGPEVEEGEIEGVFRGQTSGKLLFETTLASHNLFPHEIEGCELVVAERPLDPENRCIIRHA